mmetsp:Transcript_15643/g.37090  ORF Transcript_15643/g.37090 Transcript_15643/m.37090 type:complete len:230 (+) Transcript_15643:570-1259(+)
MELGHEHLPKVRVRGAGDGPHRTEAALLLGHQRLDLNVDGQVWSNSFWNRDVSWKEVESRRVVEEAAASVCGPVGGPDVGQSPGQGLHLSLKCLHASIWSHHDATKRWRSLLLAHTEGHELSEGLAARCYQTVVCLHDLLRIVLDLQIQLQCLVGRSRGHLQDRARQHRATHQTQAGARRPGHGAVVREDPAHAVARSHRRAGGRTSKKLGAQHGDGRKCCGEMRCLCS